jgi:FlaA1/EpsC-like NDP-sugar epimerase
MTSTDPVSRMTPILRRRLRTSSLAVLDALAWIIAFGLVVALTAALPALGDRAAAAVAVGLATLQVAAGFVAGIYRLRFRLGTVSELRALGATAVLVVVVALAVQLLGFPGATVDTVSFGTLALTAPVALVLEGGVRLILRRRREQRRPAVGAAKRVLIYGAGEVGTALARRMLTDSHRTFTPVGFIDDDETLGRLRVESVPVVGTRHSLAEAASETGAEVLAVAIARAEPELLRAVSAQGVSAGLRVLVVPPLEDMLRGLADLDDLRAVSMEDLVGRQPVTLSGADDVDYIAGRVVLVTGAGGSIGSELCRQISGLGPARLIMLDRDETALQGVQVAVSGSGLLDTPDVVLADIRDSDQIDRLFAELRPDVVFHAAALKHLPMLERYPTEGWKTNVLGTLNVLRASQAIGVTTFVNVSTDKAANPTSVLGQSKRVAERLTAGFAETTHERYLSVRFGNVLGSRGSLVPLFTELIRKGQALTITDPEATRYFMSIPEACMLVTKAGAIGQPGEVLILDMGEPVNILDVAQRMIALSGKEVDIVVTGLRPGEKLHEELVGEGETDRRRVHPKIAHADVPPILPSELSLDRFLGVEVAAR